MNFALRRGVPETQRAAAAALYWEAFAGKLGPLLGPPERGRAFLERVIDPDFAIVAIAPDETLLGLSGFQTLHGAFVGGGFRDLRAQFGLFGAAWRVPLLALLDRKAVPDQLMMDGICVEARARGQGIGAALIGEIEEVARELGLSEVRLDVIDTNPRAKRLYVRLGFEVTGAQDLGPLGGIFGFRRAETMVRVVAQGHSVPVSRKSPSPGPAG